MTTQMWRKLPKMTIEEWHAWRAQGIGSSDAPVIMGVSPWKTPRQLWDERIYKKADEDTRSKKRGRDLEEPARRCFEKKMGMQVFAVNTERLDKTWMHASLDGLDLDGKCAVEIKCPGREDHEMAMNKKIPDKYYPQVQHQLAVLGLDGMYYFSFDGTDGVVVEVSRNQEYIDRMLVAEEHFYKCVVIESPPEFGERDVVCMDSHEDWSYVAPQWIKICNDLRELEREEEHLRAKLIDIAGDRSCQGSGIRLTKSITKGTIDYGSIPELKNVDLEKYRKNSFTKWRLSSM